MRAELVEQVLSEDTADDATDDERLSIQSKDRIAGALLIVAAGVWVVAGGLSGWVMTGVFGFPVAVEALCAAVGLLLGVVLLRHLSVTDGTRHTALLVVIALGSGLVIASIVFAVGMFALAS